LGFGLRGYLFVYAGKAACTSKKLPQPGDFDFLQSKHTKFEVHWLVNRIHKIEKEKECVASLL
jgi:hypothetical protein